MTPKTIFVQLPDGNTTLKLPKDIELEDTVFFDGPDAFADMHRMQAQLDAEIADAGGLEAWRKLGSRSDRLAA